MHNSLLLFISRVVRGLFFSPLLVSYIIGGDPINIDGLFEDWDDVPISYSDQNGDATTADYSLLKITHDSEFLFIYFY